MNANLTNYLLFYYFGAKLKFLDLCFLYGDVVRGVTALVFIVIGLYIIVGVKNEPKNA